MSVFLKARNTTAAGASTAVSAAKAKTASDAWMLGVLSLAVFILPDIVLNVSLSLQVRGSRAFRHGRVISTVYDPELSRVEERAVIVGRISGLESFSFSEVHVLPLTCSRTNDREAER